MFLMANTLHMVCVTTFFVALHCCLSGEYKPSNYRVGILLHRPYMFLSLVYIGYLWVLFGVVK
jgi:hypothetical protein